ncbi:rhodanese-like domain-containing protein [Vibrio sp. DW001]|jgi:rhodanese-related sulfurtransferase|uniref:rhodanese-like domain-containing protein n=1 Tax=unclassified Vibrio TaxID=2614977 RepID=UPI00189DEAAA|nr:MULTISPECIES: rhodanese-like domain-containing protein [unclassified Vibrio]UGA55006.1 rhodanese-like domain-containing protein [Vibrio sp. VB16]WED26896.1 rhodanese-like domain-containing protein [Vibrio sp. DW001]
MQEYIDFVQGNMLLAMAFVGIVVALILNIYKTSTAKYKEISPAQLTQFINRDEGVVIDIRTKDEFKQGHITGALHILPSEIKSGTVPNLEKYKESPITVVCKSGQAATENANLLAKAGYENVNLLKGGILSWSEAKMPLVRGKK